MIRSGEHLILKDPRKNTTACALAAALALASGAAFAAHSLRHVPFPRPRPPAAGSAHTAPTPAASAVAKDEAGLPFNTAVSMSKSEDRKSTRLNSSHAN